MSDMGEIVCPDIPFFGANYPDATCIDGRLWDLDSCDEPGGPLFGGGDVPCPFCRPQEHINEIAEDLYSSGEFETIEAAHPKALKYVNSLRARYGFKPVGERP